MLWSSHKKAIGWMASIANLLMDLDAKALARLEDVTVGIPSSYTVID
jgi:hypothetical protein